MGNSSASPDPERRQRPAPSAAHAAVVMVLAVLFLAAALPAFSAGSHTAGATLLKNLEYADALLQGIRDARSRITLSCYLFKINHRPDNLPRQVAEELVRAGQRGVRVTVILERSNDPDDPLNRANLHAATYLSGKGVSVRFDSPDTTSHSKCMVIDGRFVYLGSHNLTHPALSRNNELSVRLDSPELAREAETFMGGI